MDPFTALSLAGVVVQFVELGIKLTLKSIAVYRSADGHAEIDEATQEDTRSLRGLSKKLRQSFSGPCSTAELNIASLAQECAAEAKKLLRILEGLKSVNKGMASSIVAASKSLWKKGEIEEIHERLKDYRAQITLCLAALINDKNSSMTALLVELTRLHSSTNLEMNQRFKQLSNGLAQVQSTITQASNSVSDGKTDLDAMVKDLDGLVRLGDAASESVLQGLRFEYMRARESNISAAHAKTFEWLFTEESDFYKWLQSSSGIFWISGKPGSGKSTLMKFVSNHHRTKEALLEWAGKDLLITLGFYFWNPGTPMQKSLQGLLQTLLYQVMKAYPLLIPVITPGRWDIALSAEAAERWTWDETIVSFDLFLRQDKVACKTCVFIDGLDEFDGDHAEVVNILSRASESPNVKLCLASRPYNIFMEAYGRKPDRMLRLQDLTRGDIRQYANDKLQMHLEIAKAPISDPLFKTLVDELVSKADGVFLWVYLVVRSLKEGITNADTIATLQKRLHKLPSDLEQYFAFILESVDEVYWEDTTKVFLMAMTAPYPFAAGVLSALDQDDPDFCINATTQSVNMDVYEQKIQILERRLMARCKGLLELRVTANYRSGTDHDGTFTPANTYSVDFLHRTVRDFLRVRKVHDPLLSRLTAPFDVEVTLCQGLLLQLKHFIISNDNPFNKRKSVVVAFDDLLYFAQSAEAISGTFPTRIFDEAIRTLIKWSPHIPNFTMWSIEMRIIRYGPSWYIESQLPKLNFEATPPPLLIALTSLNILTTRDIEPRYDPALSPSSVQLLLNHGASPNKMFKHDTIWKLFVQHEHARAKRGIQGTDACFEVVMMLLNAGAERYNDLTDHLRIIFKPSHARQLEEHIQYLASGPSAASVSASLDNQCAMSSTQNPREPQLGGKGKDSTKILQTGHLNGNCSAFASRTGHNDPNQGLSSNNTIGMLAPPQPGVEPRKPKPRRLRLILSCFRP